MRGVSASRVISDSALSSAHILCGRDPGATALSLGLSRSQVNKRLARIRLAGGSDRPTVLEPSNALPNRVQQVIDNASIAAESIGELAYVDVGEWGSGGFNKNREWEEHGLFKTMARIIPKERKLPIITHAGPTTIVYNEAPRIMRKVDEKIIVSDAQIGFLRDLNTMKLEPCHDPRAIEITRQIIADIRPSGLIFIGDWMDWPVFSRWAKRAEYQLVTQASIEAGYQWKAKLIAAAGAQCLERVEIGSNHGLRPEKFVEEYNIFASGIKRANSSPDDWSVFSEPYLLRYDELGIEFSGHYPGGEYYITPSLVALHAPPKAHEFLADYVHGHMHKLSSHTPNVVHSSDGRRSYLGYDVGCLCSVDVTTNKRRLLVTKVPSDQGRTNWQQGIAHVQIINGKVPKHQVNLIRIDNGEALYQGQPYDASSFVEEPYGP